MSKMSQLHQKTVERLLLALGLSDEEWDELPETVRDTLLEWFAELEAFRARKGK